MQNLSDNAVSYEAWVYKIVLGIDEWQAELLWIYVKITLHVDFDGQI